jgi:hypothetical protein
MHPSFYKLIGNITLLPKENIIALDMSLDNTVLELGQIPFQSFPKLNTIIKVQRNQKVISNRYPTNALTNEHEGKFVVIFLCFSFVIFHFTEFSSKWVKMRMLLNLPPNTEPILSFVPIPCVPWQEITVLFFEVHGIFLLPPRKWLFKEN